eukprot:TRINITY_DN198_c0_g1_i4.p1 TRINITY_DN198_c0_g1~~TRINITY_DN198_c0_g1_i4.p1  ORF type:complete len:499 (-),score=131.82 TRINITY_DN198_c0_g1_i4:87-1583(-)
MIRRPPRSTLSSSSAASDVYKRQYQRRVHGVNKDKIKQKQIQKTNQKMLCLKQNVSLAMNFLPICQMALKKIMLPELGEKIKEATIKKWHVKVGDKVDEFDGLCDVVTDKLFTTIPSSYSGTILAIHHKEESICQTHAPLYDMDVEGDIKEDEPAQEEPKKEEPKKEEPKPKKEEPKPIKEEEKKEFKVPENVLATFAVKKMAKEMGIDLSQVKGTGKHGRIHKEDLINFNPSKAAAASSAPAEKPKQKKKGKKASALPAQPQRMKLQFDTLHLNEKQKNLQQKMQSALSIPHMYCMDFIDLTAVLKMKEDLKQSKSCSPVPNVSAFLLKAFSQSLFRYPIVNARYEPGQNQFQYKLQNQHNISIAMQGKNGIVRPVVKEVESMNIFEIQNELEIIKMKAEKDEILFSEGEDSTVSVFNIGKITGNYCGPLIFPPQVCILGLGEIVNAPEFAKEQPKKIMKVSFACDHRILDGATIARFLKDWKTQLETPANFLLHLR